MAPEPFATSDADLRLRVDRLFFDVDDTLTWRGQLPEAAALALYKARAAGLSLGVVTGRSFAWAEMLMRLFPLDAAVAETGACALVRSSSPMQSERLEVIHTEPEETTRSELARDRHIACARVLREVPEARLALDNLGRLYDCAFDLVESGPPISAESAQRIRAILAEAGLVTSQSSVHINAWKVGPHGPFDKATMVDRLLRQRFGSSLDAATATLCYVGDSENDGVMFAHAAASVGVGNITPHLEALTKKGQAPRFVVESNGGRGFAEVVAALLEDR
jgi:HAD superfamily hydrolase (TIGR01484 family)